MNNGGATNLWRSIITEYVATAVDADDSLGLDGVHVRLDAGDDLFLPGGALAWPALMPTKVARGPLHFERSTAWGCEPPSLHHTSGGAAEVAA